MTKMLLDGHGQPKVHIMPIMHAAFSMPCTLLQADNEAQHGQVSGKAARGTLLQPIYCRVRQGLQDIGGRPL